MTLNTLDNSGGDGGSAWEQCRRSLEETGNNGGGDTIIHLSGKSLTFLGVDGLVKLAQVDWELF